MSTPIIDEAAKVFADPTSYADEPRLHAALTHLRAHAPVSLVDCPPFRPFWAITKHADVMAIERANDLFINEPRPLLATAAADDMARAQLEAGMGLRTLIHMDDPQPGGAGDRRGLVSPQGNARAQASVSTHVCAPSINVIKYAAADSENCSWPST